MTAPICFLDTETDGIHPDRKPWEVAIIRRDPDGTRTVWEAFLEIDLHTADPAGLRVGRFYDRHPFGIYLTETRAVDNRYWTWTDKLINFRAAAEAIAQLTHGAHIVGAVPNFDTEILDRLLRSQQLIPAWHYHLVDVENLAVGYLAGQGIHLPPPWNSDQLTTLLGLEKPADDVRHTALGDALWAEQIYDTVLNRQGGLQ